MFGYDELEAKGP